MENDLRVMNHEETINALLASSKESLVAICKNSRLSIHVTKLIIINNILRAFVSFYSLPVSFRLNQQRLLDAIKRSEQNKRTFRTDDKIHIAYALLDYECILRSCTEEQLNEMLVFVDQNDHLCKQSFHTKKRGNRVISQ